MKVVIKYYGNKYQKYENETPESFMRATFAHVSDKVWVKGITILKAAAGQGKEDFDLIEIEVFPQGGKSEQKLVEIIEKAVGLRGKLEIVSIGQKRTLQVEAIEAVGNNTYKVDLGYAQFVAKNDSYREQLKTENTVSTKCEYVNTEGDTYTNTGKISTEIKPGQTMFDPTNVYNCFAVALSTSAEFREKILEANLLEIVLKMEAQSQVNPKGSLVISIVERNNFRFFMPSNAPEVAKPVVNNLALKK